MYHLNTHVASGWPRVAFAPALGLVLLTGSSTTFAATPPNPVQVSSPQGIPTDQAALLTFEDGFPVTHPDQLFELDRVRRGQIGIGYTVFAEDKPEPFGAEILGVMENMLGPGEDVILAKLTGEKIAFTGVIAGMSGSPVYIDGKLLGAVAYRFGNFSKEPIAGITPIGRMLPLIQSLPSGPTQAVPSNSKPNPTFLEPGWIDRRGRAHRSVDISPPQTAALGASDLAPIVTPIAASGIHPRALQQLSQTLQHRQISAIGLLGGTPSTPSNIAATTVTAGTVRAAPIRPGAPISALLTQGDITLSAIGTVTYVHNQDVLAFGHPFMGHGQVSFPMARAAILNTLASSAGSYKQGLVAEIAGAITQDRLTAISGRLGKAKAKMFPVRISVIGPGEQQRQIHVDVVEDPIWMPMITELVINSAVLQRLPAEAGGTVHMQLGVEVGERYLQIEDSYSSPAPTQVAGFAARDAGQILNIIANNPIAHSEVRRLNVTLEISREVKHHKIISAHINTPKVGRGEYLKADVHLKSYKGAVIERTLNIRIPEDAPLGPFDVYIGGGTELDLRDAQAEGGLQPQTLDELLGILSDRRSSQLLAARPYFKQSGLRVGAEIYEALPPSARTIIGTQTAQPSSDVSERPGPWSQVILPGVVQGAFSSQAIVTESKPNSEFNL